MKALRIGEHCADGHIGHATDARYLPSGEERARVVLTVWQDKGFKVTVDEGALRAAIERSLTRADQLVLWAVLSPRASSPLWRSGLEGE